MERKREIYYKKDKALELENKRLENTNISESNKNLLLEYQDHLAARHTQQYRISKVSCLLRKICELLYREDLAIIDRRRMKSLVAAINRNESWGDHTKRDYKRALKQFFYWYEEEDPRLDDPDELVRQSARKLYGYLRKHVKTPKPRSKIKRSDLITDDDLRRMIVDGCRNSLERAFISLLHERPMRVGEILRMQIQDIEHKGKHAVISIPDGKSGIRTVPVLKSVPYLQEWLKDHPLKGDATAPLWVSKHNGHCGKPLSYTGIRKMLQRIATGAGINKRVHSHLFRHSRATLDAGRYTTAILSKMGGWVQGSRQLATYVHLSAEDVEQQFLEQSGLTEEGEKKPEVHYCGVCGVTNPLENRYCFKCGNALRVETYLDDEKLKNNAINDDMRWFQDVVMGNPELFLAFRQRFQNK